LTRVVLADDDHAFREILVEVLDADDRFEVVGVAGDAVEVIALVEQTDPDLVLLDVRMPGGGPVAAQAITAAGNGRPKVVALSAQAGSSHVLAMLRGGVVGYLVKGNVGADLPQLLARIARGEVILAAPGADQLLKTCWHRP
jgi:DNA-binding NarL/FixJ family response regulator